ncbi:ScbA/BarX family gamma-butyrolactone biosynthesis protein [Streptomyces sp. NPDC089799]|uniref:ScbA/BarX family gamma-butyrolactone biosynthesis protein n=1 Tax=Streptomyces sp. NPDC089799 TaxID=3155066 RepID=UPI0034399F74
MHQAAVIDCLRPGATELKPASHELCHRVRPEDAFALGWTELAKDRFLVRVGWPTSHPFFAPVHGGIHDPLLIVETMRQSTMAVLHAGYGIPLDHHFLLTELEYVYHPEGFEVGGPEDRADLEITFSDLVHRGRNLSHLTVDWVIRRDCRTVATGGGRARLISPGVYRRLRGGRDTPVSFRPQTHAADAALVGRSRPEDVLLSPTPANGLWELRPDTEHPTLFQRPSDHIPGMLLFEAARQAAAAAVAPVPFLPARGSIVFHQYAEFDSPCLVEAVPVPAREHGTSTLEVTGHQAGAPLFHCTFTTPLSF